MLTGGILKAINNLTGYTPPWANDTYLDMDAVEMEYYGNHSGSKLVSPLVTKLLNDDGELTSTSMILLAKTIVSRYSESWIRLHEIVESDYNPVENYDRYESVSDHSASSESADSNRQTNYGRTSGTDQNVNNAQKNNIFGFDTSASEGVPDTYSSASGSTSISTSEGGSDSESSTSSGSMATDSSHSARIHGNIGVTTATQMLAEHRDFWAWSFWQSVFADIDKVLCLSVYY